MHRTEELQRLVAVSVSVSQFFSSVDGDLSSASGSTLSFRVVIRQQQVIVVVVAVCVLL